MLHHNESAMKILLVVCTGNTCRSPMAEAILADKLSKNPRFSGHVRVLSAGLMAEDGAPMTDYARTALERMGITSGVHAARRFTAGLAAEADLILAMEARHVRDIIAAFPHVEVKTHTLKGFAANKDNLPAHAGEYDIADPFWQPLESYIAAAKEISAAVQKVLTRLENMDSWALLAPDEREESF